ncbi:hypothetical protein CKA32_001641 [Geitlerinema sp. FC II]|nr:hypothetical protein CKA32_001641 [Geitlerinema sp. FC II]
MHEVEVEKQWSIWLVKYDCYMKFRSKILGFNLKQCFTVLICVLVTSRRSSFYFFDLRELS